MSNAKVYCKSDADAYFRRNLHHGVSALVEYLKAILPAEKLHGMSVAEFGIGNGANLLFLAEFARTCRGFEVSTEAVHHFESVCQPHHHAAKLSVRQVNLATPFTVTERHELILFGFFPYNCDDRDMQTVLQNTLACLQPGGMLYVFDFLTRTCRKKPDSRNKQLHVYKRNFSWWNHYLEAFDLLDFRLFDSMRIDAYHTLGTAITVDTDCAEGGTKWLAQMNRKRTRLSRPASWV